MGARESADLILLKVMGRITYERYKFWRHTGYVPDLHNPRTFNEKLSAWKLFGSRATAPSLTDKVAVRDYVERTVGHKYLVDVCTIAEQPDDLDLDRLPDSFVAKTNNGSGLNVFVADKREIDPGHLRRQLAGYLKRGFGRTTNEWFYGEISPRILVEQYVHGGPDGEPMDYKFLVFHGKAAYVQVLDYTTRLYTSDFYDLDWQPAGFRYPHRPTRGGRSRPGRLEEMREVAEALAGDLDFVRVDLYRLEDEQVRFGELTLTPGAGWAPISPIEAALHLGSLW
jgi:hypothetical protein